MTSRGCGRSVIASRGSSAELGHRADAPGEDALAIEFILGGLEQVAPRGDIRATTKQGATLTLGHAAPDAELDAVVEGVGEALGADLAADADGLRPVLSRPLDEQGVRIGGAAGRLSGPIGVERHA